MKKKKMFKFIAVAATTTVAVSSIGTPVSILANTTEVESSAQNTITSQTQVSKFTMYSNSESLSTYNEVFKVDTAKITAENNGGFYNNNSQLQNIFDGNLNTYWETRTPNKTDFTNEITFTFDEVTKLNRVIYAPRLDGAPGKGFPLTFEIQGKVTEDADFQVVAEGSYSSNTRDAIEIQFEATDFKQLKFVFKNANADWAAASEFMFYKEDPVLDKIKNLFTDGTRSEVVAEYNTLDKITALANEAKTHVHYDAFNADLELAQKIVKGELNTEGTIFTAEQVGNRKEIIFNHTRTDIGSNLQPTGLAVKAGKEITVYVDADGATKLPTIVFSQTEGAWSNWSRSVQLSPGKNVITVPEVPKDNKYHYDVTKGGMIYIVNPYTKEQQGEAPVIRIEGAEKVPFMTKDTDPAVFKQFLTAYKEKIDADKVANPNVADREVLDVVEIVSDHVIYTGTATNAYTAYITQDKNPKATVDGYDVWMHDIFNIHGLDDRSEIHSTDLIREPIRVMQPWGFMYAAGDHTGIQLPQESLMFGDFRVNYPGWGLNHEIGHRIDMGVREWAEVTNNMTSMSMSIVAGNIDNRIPYADIYKYVIQEEKATKWSALGLAHRLGTFWQLELAYDGYWANLESLYRERKGGGGDDTQKQQTMIQYSSDVLKQDLSTYFEKHGFDVTEETKAYTQQYEESGKYWYLNNSVIGYTGTGFTENASVDLNITTNESNKTNTLTFSIDDANTSHLLGYEILRDGEVIGFTSNSSFVDTNVDPSQNYHYQVIAYDKKLNTLAPVGVKAFKPTISVSDQLTLKLNQPFNSNDFVKAYAYNGEDITSDVQVQFSNVDTTKRGDYQVTFTVTNQGITEAKTVDVHVVSDFDYLSDLKATSHNIDWGGLKLDQAPEGTAITLLRGGIATTYKKGIGAHANSEIVYNVEGKEYNYFESYIGIDQAMKGKNSSATFEVWIDDEKVYESGVFSSGTEQQFIKVPITEGAKNVKLVTTNANINHNTSDHTVWADAKFTKDSSKPVISISSEATKVGEPIDIVGNYTATDVEDGDLTAQVKIVGTEAVDFDQAGDYKLTYTVTDSDGHEVTATRTISVVDMQDFNYLSAYNWQSESHSYAAPKKDLATSGNKLRLTDESGNEVVYANGIGAHANSTIVYDLTDTEAAYFTSYVGVDRHMYNSVGSVVFEVYVDGEKKFDSGLMTAKMAQQYVEVSLAGAKELKLVVTDGGNGIGSDHATWGDAKLHYANEDRLKGAATEEVTMFSLADKIVEADGAEEVVTAEAHINRIVQVVKDVLKEVAVNISDIKAIVAGNPANTTFSGTEAELAVKALIEEQFSDIPGTFEIVLHNRGTSETVEELIESGLTITYRVTDSESTVTYKNGLVTKN